MRRAAASSSAYDARRKSDLFAFDTARVLAAMGIRTMLHPGVQPTPVLAWSITGIEAAAGVVVTASHNPPADNGYKVFLATGSQIVDPVDRQISECIDRFDPLAVPLAADDDPHIIRLDTSWVDAYLDAIPAVRLRPEVAGGVVAYTAMHGVGGAVLERAFAAAGFDPPVVVAEQHQPDGTFPTVSFPNPEEPGAMDLLLDVARRCGAHVALANDPDADRLGAAIPQRDGSWRRLTGDEIGWLFADHILANTTGDDRLVITTIVSSSLLARMAEAAGVECEETFTGFKWIGKVVTERPDRRFVFGYEQALGYLVTNRPLDKDGISAAVLMAEIAGLALADGVTLEDRLDAIAARFGRYVTAELSVRLDPAVGAEWVRAIEASPPAEVGGRRWSRFRRIPRRASSAWWWKVACGCRSARAAPNRRSSSTARPSTSISPSSPTSSPPSPPQPPPDSVRLFVWGRGRNEPGSFGVGAETNPVRLGSGPERTERSEGAGECGDQIELGADLGAGHRTVGSHRRERGFDVDTEQHQQGDGGGARPADAGRAVHDEHLAVLQTPHEVVEEGPVDVEIGRAQIVDREPDRTTSLTVRALTIDERSRRPLVEPRHVPRPAIGQFLAPREAHHRGRSRALDDRVDVLGDVVLAAEPQGAGYTVGKRDVVDPAVARTHDQLDGIGAAGVPNWRSPASPSPGTMKACSSR